MSAPPTANRTGAGYRPRLARGLAVLRCPDRLVIEGAAKRQVFAGRAATELLPSLFELLDGRHDVAALAEATGRREPEIVRALRLLDQGGLIEWVQADQPELELDAAADAYLSRGLSLTRRHREVRTVVAALDTARVLVLGTGTLAEAVLCALRESGMRAAVGISGLPTDPQRHHLAVLCESDVPDLASTLNQLWNTGTPVLRVGGDAERLDLGPLFHPRWTCCPDCWSQAAEVDMSGLIPEHAVELAAGLVCAEALAVLSGITSPVAVGRVVRRTLADLREEVLQLTPEPGCARCLPHRPDPAGLLAARYERAVAWTPWTERDETRETVSRIRYQYAASPQFPVDQLPDELRNLFAAPEAADEVDVYLLGADALPYPVYLHDPETGRLVATRPSADPVPLGLPGEPVAVLVLVAAPVRRYAERGAESLRLAYLRAGVLLAKIQQAAVGCRLEVTTRCDPVLRELLELRAEQEVPAAVVGVYKEDARAADH